MEIDEFALTNSKIIESEFNINPVKTTFHLYNNAEWQILCHSIDIDCLSEGVYLPRNLEAHLLEQCKFLEINFLHEYFGHGLFCEHAKKGKILVSLEKDLIELEKKILGLVQLPDKKMISIDNRSPYFKQYIEKQQQIVSFFKENLGLYEGFAIWMEYYLAKQNNKEAMFEEKFSRPAYKRNKGLLEKFIKFEKENGVQILMHKVGFYTG